jgi:hypothetical protein
VGHVKFPVASIPYGASAVLVSSSLNPVG